MGKYSLENYEQYRTIKCRPAALSGHIANPGAGSFFAVQCAWKETEPVRGGFCFEKTQDMLHNASTVLLELNPEPPEWAEGLGPLEREALADSWLRRAAVELGNGRGSFAACLSAPVEERLQTAFFLGFFRTWRLLRPNDAPGIALARRENWSFGLLAEIGSSPLDACESFARQGLQSIWEHAPVLVRSRGANADWYGRLAKQWRAAACEQTDFSTGYRLELRRLTYPAALTSGGAAPLRFWWTNSGESPCYLKTEIRIRLVRGGAEYPLPLGDRPVFWPVGDRVWNEIIRLPDLETGEYALEYGVFLPDGTPLRLASEGAVGGGWYRAGNMPLDRHPRPELERAWESYYPEGYYPLEDPAHPE